MSENLKIEEVQSSKVYNFEIEVTGECEISKEDLIPWVRLVISQSEDFTGEKRWGIVAYIYGVFEFMCSPDITIFSPKGNLPPSVEELNIRINDLVGDVLEGSGFRFGWEAESYIYDDGMDDSVEVVEGVIKDVVENVLAIIEEELSEGEKWKEIEIPVTIWVNLKFWANRESFEEVRGDEPIILLVNKAVKIDKILNEGGWEIGRAVKISEVYDKLVTLLSLACDPEDDETNQGYEDLLHILQEYMERDGEVVIEIE